MHVRAPATTANLGPGFDSLGLALGLYNELFVELGGDGVAVEVVGEGAGTLPTDETHGVARVMQGLFDRIGKKMPGLRLRQVNRIPLARGLGSSAAAIASGLVAANVLAGNALSQQQLVDLAAQIEGHPDNVTACLVGGLAVSAVEGNKVYFAPVAIPEGLEVVLYIPEFQVSTEAARRELSETYSRADAVFTLSRAALTTAALATGRWDLLRIGMQDCMHQPYRARAYPEMPCLLQAALDAGAHGAALSGSGPTIAAFTSGGAENVARALTEMGGRCGIKGHVVQVAVDSQGTVVVDE